MLVGLSAPVLTMAIAVGIELSGWTVTEQRLQRTADAAALAAAEAYQRGATAKAAATYGAYVAEINGASGAASRGWSAYTQTLADNMITIQMTAGVVNTNDTAFVATVQAKVPLLFSHIVLTGSTTELLGATATAEIATSQIGKYCVLALDSSAATGFSTAGMDLSNGATVDVSQCGVEVNASGVDALDLTGGAALKATSVSVNGQISVSNGASMSVTGSTVTGASLGTNPYAGVSVPTPGTCNTTNNYYGTTTIYPGTYCNGLSFSSGNITMSPGVYIINGGKFAPAGGSTVTGNGVTIVLTGNSTNGYATAQIANGTTINLTAPTTGSTAGIVIMQDPAAPGGTTNNFAGGTSLNLTGALVFPSQIVDFSNGSSNNSSCTQLIAFQIQFAGGTRFGNNCAGTGTLALGASSSVNLVQ